MRVYEGQDDGEILLTFYYRNVFFGEIGVTLTDVFQSGLGRIQYLSLALQIVANDELYIFIDKNFYQQRMLFADDIVFDGIFEKYL